MSSILDQEIHEQPEAVARFLASQSTTVAQIAAAIGQYPVTHVMIAARGTSDNAARYAQYLFGAHNQLPVVLATPSLYTLYQTPPRVQQALVIGISQSGRSPDIVNVIETSRQQGQPTLAITNDPASPLAQAAEWVIPLQAGQERAVAATKTYTTSLAALALLSTALAGNREPQHLAQLAQAPTWMQATLEASAAHLGRVERYTYINRSAVIGRGFNYSTSFEVALKIKELTRIVTEPYSSADFLHGPISVLEPGFPLIVIAPSGKTQADLSEFITNVKQRGAETVVISDHAGTLAQADIPFALPAGVPEWLSPLIAVLPGQLIAMQLTISKRLDPDNPKGLTKVTETL